MFTLDVHADGTYMLLHVRGELDLHTCQLFRDRLTDLIRQSAQPIVIDLSDLLFIDSSGLGALLAIIRMPEDRRPRIVLSPANAQVNRLLRTTHLDVLLRVHPSVEAALSRGVPAGSAA